jgi:hypothetical protein
VQKESGDAGLNGARGIATAGANSSKLASALAAKR